MSVRDWYNKKAAENPEAYGKMAEEINKIPVKEEKSLVDSIKGVLGDVQQSIIEQGGNIQQDILGGAGPIQQSIIEQGGNIQQDIIKAWGEVEKNPVVDFVQKNNVVSMITNPDESTIIKTVKDTAGDVQQDIISWGGDVQQSILDGYDNIAKWGGKNWPILAAAGGALLLILLK